MRTEDPPRGSQEFNLPCHLVRFEDFVNEDQTGDDLADGSGALLTLGDPCVRSLLVMQTSCACITRSDRTTIGGCPSEVLRISGAEQPGLVRRDPVDTTLPQSCRDRGRDVLI